MKKFLKRKLNILTGYLTVSAIVFLLVIMPPSISAFLSYKNNLGLYQKSLDKEVIRVENIVLGEITEHSWWVRSIANKIKNKSDLKDINKIISYQNKFDFNLNNNQLLNQKNLYWTDFDDNIVIKNRVGIIDYPKKAFIEYSTNNSKSNPWKLIVSDNLPYFENDYNLIPTSFGVTSKDGKYLGSIISFLDPNFIQNLLNESGNSVDNNLVILNPQNNKIILQSNQEHSIKNPEFFVGKINYKNNQSSYIKQTILEDGFKYSQYKKIENYPLMIIAGYNLQQYQSDLIKSLIRSILPSFGIGLLLLATLFLFYKRTIKPIRNLCEVAKKIGIRDYSNYKLPRNINCPEIYDLTKALLKIKYQKISIDKSHSKMKDAKKQLEEAIEVANRSDIAQIEIVKQIRTEIFKNTAQVFQNLNILKYNINNTSAVFSNQINLHLIENIEQEINNITKFATDELNKEYIEIKYVIDRVVLSQEKEIKTRNIILEIDYEKNLPKKVFVDQIRLIQILSSILNKTVKLLIDGRTIRISIKNIIKNKSKHIAIKIEDNGIGIGIKEHLESAKRLGGYEENAINGIDISINTIEELVKLHGGEILYENEIRKGSSTTIVIPILIKERKPKPVATKNITDNIVYLPARNS